MQEPGRQYRPAADERDRQLRFALGLTALVLLGELVGGLWTRSLALLSDAGHVFSDVFSLAVSLIAVRLACRPPTGRHSYGLHRAEVFAALVNGLLLIGICVLILREAWLRVAQPPEVNSVGMLGVAVVGLLANGFVATRLKGHSHRDLNLRSAYLHVLGDLLASVGVVVGALVISLTGWRVVDPLLSAGIALLILTGALGVIRESVHILLEGTPRGIRLDEVAQAMLQVPGVKAVHHLHAWSLCSSLAAFSAHVITCPKNEQERVETRRRLDDLLIGRFGFTDTTVEFECEPCCEDPPLLKHRTHDHQRAGGSVSHACDAGHHAEPGH